MNLMNNHDDKRECKPLKNLQQITQWKPDRSDWSNQVISLISRSNYCYEGDSFECYRKIRKPLKILTSGSPRTLVCHDMKGGYLDDKFIEGTSYQNQYIFYHWPLIDVFIYFSHNLITIPPLMWINAAHKNGVRILGTVITEHPNGHEIWNKILSDDTTLNLFTNKLAEICIHYRFDGYLINIENEIEEQHLPRLKLFLKNLKNSLGKSRTLIWYDSVSLIDGKLKWQNQLNEHNEAAFRICDGIYLNYGWNDACLKNTLTNAGSRQFDVYVGIDVFGRGCFGGGGFNTDMALQLVKSFALSSALFGTGWTHETQSVQTSAEFFAVERKFWSKLLPFLYIHVPNCVPFETTFNRGVVQRIEESTLWYNLSSQSYQTSVLSCTNSNVADRCIQFNEDGNCTSGGGGIILEKNTCETDVHRILLCDFECSSEKPLRFVVAAKTKDDLCVPFRLILLVENDDKNFTVVLKFSESKNNTADAVVGDDEYRDYSYSFETSKRINSSKFVNFLQDNYVSNEFILDYDGRLSEIYAQWEKSTIIKFLRFYHLEY